jgi:hypothetical protein
MDSAVLETCVIKELEIAMQELMFAHQRHESEGDEERATLVLAQLILCGEIYGAFQRNSDWDDFRESLEDYVWSETERYREARFADDRGTARIMLARVRCTRRLLIRLNNQERLELHAKTWFLKPDAPGNNPLADMDSKYHKEAMRLGLGYADTNEFQEGDEISKIDPEHKRLKFEANRLRREIKERVRDLVSSEGAYAQYLKTQERAVDTLFSYFKEPSDWSKLKDFLLERIESSDLYYRQVREAGDYATAVTTMGYLRFFRTLQRRISAPLPRRELLRRIEVALKIH